MFHGRTPTTEMGHLLSQMGFPQLRGTFWGGTYSKDCSSLGIYIGVSFVKADYQVLKPKPSNSTARFRPKHRLIPKPRDRNPIPPN